MVDTKTLQVNYTDHLKLDQILNAQQPLSDHPEEMLFVIIHQVYELWFKELLHDFARVISHLEADKLSQATWLLQRCGRIMQVADTQLGVLEMMSAADFQEFRPYLKESSGLQSRQFRKLEVMGGLGETVGEKYAKRVAAQWPGLLEEAPVTLHQALLNVIERHDQSLLDIYQNRWQHFDLFGLCEACIELDRRIITWRQNHVKMVERMIGNLAQGTGGTFGSEYLAATTTYRFFPEVWQVRNDLTIASGGKLYT